VVAFAEKHNILVCHDAAYTEMAFDGYRPPSFLEVDGAKEVGMEFHSLSKTYNMTGWRIGFAVGNPEGVAGLGRHQEQYRFRCFSGGSKGGHRGDSRGPGVRFRHAPHL
jgi:LL-diaminopimelate aminotransferase